jgi:hypothetical protein
MREFSEKYSISISTLHSWRRLLAYHGTLQAKQRGYSGRRPKFFHKEVEAIPFEDRFYLDESSLDESLVEDRAYALRGQKIYATRCGNRKKFNRKSLIAVHTPQQKNLLVAPFLYEGTTNTELLLYSLEHVFYLDWHLIKH